jgi:hypothetical protein
VSAQKVVVGAIAIAVGLLFVAGSIADTARADAAAPDHEVPPVPHRAVVRLVAGVVVIAGTVFLLGWMVFA